MTLPIVLAWTLLLNPVSSASSDDLQQRARQLFYQLRCVVCEGQALAESNAPIAQDMRALIRLKLLQGDSEHDIIIFLKQRYGASVAGIGVLTVAAGHGYMLMLIPIGLIVTIMMIYIFWYRSRRHA